VVTFCLAASTMAYGLLKITVGIRLSPHEELIGSDLAVHRIEAYPEDAL
jgi:Amt family ammonium transporter